MHVCAFSSFLPDLAAARQASPTQKSTEVEENREEKTEKEPTP